MFGMNKLDRHSDLVSRMAEATGADFATAITEGVLSPNGLRSVVLRCTACDHVAECEHWLAEAEPGAAAPEFCASRATFAAAAEVAK